MCLLREFRVVMPELFSRLHFWAIDPLFYYLCSVIVPSESIYLISVGSLILVISGSVEMCRVYLSLSYFFLNFLKQIFFLSTLMSLWTLLILPMPFWWCGCTENTCSLCWTSGFLYQKILPAMGIAARMGVQAVKVGYLHLYILTFNLMFSI